MPYYIQRGNVPRKRHTVFRQKDGGLYCEHLMGALGFSGPASLLYHVHAPTRVLESQVLQRVALEADENDAVRMRHFLTHDLSSDGNFATSRRPLLFNQDVVMWMSQLEPERQPFYRNAQADEVLYVSEGTGSLLSEFGKLDFQAGDYLVVPRGILQQLVPNVATRLLIIESTSYVRFPRRYLTGEGQLMEHAPFCERDIRPPELEGVTDDESPHEMIVKQNDTLSTVTLDHYPLDVVGWDGCYYPWALSIHDFEPIVGSLHQPPPVHQTFQSDQFVICSFVPRLFDFHPDAIPAPYNHSNVMSDEVIYYANNEFMSRKGIQFGSLTLHPAGLPHGPHPGRAEESIGKRSTDELAVMVDTFRPLRVARDIVSSEDANYKTSWVDE